MAAHLLGRLCDSWEGRRALEREPSAVDKLVRCLGSDEPSLAVRRSAAGALARLAGTDDGWEVIVCGQQGADLPSESTAAAASTEQASDAALPVSAARGESGCGPPTVLQRVVDACAEGHCPEAVVCLAGVGARHEEGAAMLLRAGGMRMALQAIQAAKAEAEEAEAEAEAGCGPFVAAGPGAPVGASPTVSSQPKSEILALAALSCIRSMAQVWVGKLAAVGHAVGDHDAGIEDRTAAANAVAQCLAAHHADAVRRAAAGVMLLLLVSTEGKLAWWGSKACRDSIVAALGDEDARVRRDADLSLVQLWQLPTARRPLARMVLLAPFAGLVERQIREASMGA